MKPRACVSVVTLLATVVLSACGTIGEKDFACPGRPSGVRCMSASEVYQATQHTDVVEPTAIRGLGDEPQRANASEAPQVRRAAGTAPGHRVSSRKHTVEPLKAGPPALSANRPIPIRTPAQVMRVWIAPWEDVRGVLHGGEHAFIEIVERRWSVGERETTEPARFFSIQSAPDPAPESAKARKPAKSSAATSRPEPSSVPHASPQGESR